MMPKTKRAVTALIWNVIIGLVLIGISFLIFMFIQSKIGELKNPSVSDVQYVDFESSYAGVMSKVDKQEIEKFYTNLFENKDNEKFIYNSNSIKKFNTFDSDIAQEEEISEVVVGTTPGVIGSPLGLGKTIVAKEVRFENKALYYFYNGEIKALKIYEFEESKKISCDTIHKSYCIYLRALS